MTNYIKNHQGQTHISPAAGVAGTYGGGAGTYGGGVSTNGVGNIPTSPVMLICILVL